MALWGEDGRQGLKKLETFEALADNPVRIELWRVVCVKDRL
jgi:hypothetical protein